MKRYAARSASAELIDAPDIPYADWSVCLRELNTINTWLGGHAITIQGVQRLLGSRKGKVTIAEIGCGGGNNLKAIHKWNNNRRTIEYIGIDMNKACTDFAIKNCSTLGQVRFIHSDFRAVDFKNHYPDIIFSSLFCHHFNNDQLVEMLDWLKKNSGIGFFINDLHRHPLAYHSIQWLTRMFSASYLVKNDAPISVLRGFKKAELRQLLQMAGIQQYSIQWKWAFRYLICVQHA